MLLDITARTLSRGRSVWINLRNYPKNVFKNVSALLSLPYNPIDARTSSIWLPGEREIGFEGFGAKPVAVLARRHVVPSSAAIYCA